MSGEKLGLDAIFGEGAANDALLDSSDDDTPPKKDPAPQTPVEETTPAPAASEPDAEAMEVDDDSATVIPAAQPATGGPSGNMSAAPENAKENSKTTASQLEKDGKRASEGKVTMREQKSCQRREKCQKQG